MATHPRGWIRLALDAEFAVTRGVLAVRFIAGDRRLTALRLRDAA
jgi:hypothetical protein